MSGNARILGAHNGGCEFDNNIYSDRLLLMLFNSAVKNIENAVKAIEANNFSQAHIQIIIAQNIIGKWVLSLPGDSPEAKSLVQTYEYLQSKLSDANIKKDTTLLSEIRDFMIQLSDTACRDEEAFARSGLGDVALTAVFSETG